MQRQRKRFALFALLGIPFNRNLGNPSKHNASSFWNYMRILLFFSQLPIQHMPYFFMTSFNRDRGGMAPPPWIRSCYILHGFTLLLREILHTIGCSIDFYLFPQNIANMKGALAITLRYWPQLCDPNFCRQLTPLHDVRKSRPRPNSHIWNGHLNWDLRSTLYQICSSGRYVENWTGCQGYCHRSNLAPLLDLHFGPLNLGTPKTWSPLLDLSTPT